MDVSNAAKRLRYDFARPEEERDECERAFWLQTIVDRNISGTLSFVVPPDPEAFTDLNATYISVTLRVVKADGSPLGETDLPFLSPGSLQSLFESCQVYLNDGSLEPSNAYSWGATLTSYLGVSKTAREDVWGPLAGMVPPNHSSSRVGFKDRFGFGDAIKLVAGSKVVTLRGRLMSDFTQSVAQLLPPRVKMEVKLRRSPDDFSICSCTEDRQAQYKLDISEVSMFVRRVRLRKAVMERTLTSLADGGGLAYTRMSCIMNQVPARGVTYRCGNLFGGGELPHTLYLLLPNQRAFSGDQSFLGNYFESGHVRSLQVFENGRPVMTQPIRTRFVYDDETGFELQPALSDATEPFLSMAQAMNGIADSQITAGLRYDDFLYGCIVWCVQLNSCGGKRMAPGFVDVQLTLEDDIARDPMLLLAFGEFDKFLSFDNNFRLIAQ